MKVTKVKKSSEIQKDPRMNYNKGAAFGKPACPSNANQSNFDAMFQNELRKLGKL